MIRRPPRSPLFPYTTLSDLSSGEREAVGADRLLQPSRAEGPGAAADLLGLPEKVGGSAGSFSSRGDRKSTRLNSSHPSISYAVFCLKKKKKDDRAGDRERRH